MVEVDELITLSPVVSYSKTVLPSESTILWYVVGSWKIPSLPNIAKAEAYQIAKEQGKPIGRPRANEDKFLSTSVKCLNLSFLVKNS